MSVVCLLALVGGLFAMSVGCSFAESDDVIQAGLTALASNDWHAIYGMLEDNARKGQPESAFTAKLAGLPAFFDASVDGDIEEVNLLGDTITVVPVGLSVYADDGSVVTYASSLSFIKGKLHSWKVPVLLRPVEEVTQAALDAISAGDWSAFYDLLDEEYKTQLTRSEFVSSLSAHGFTRFFDAGVDGPATENHILGNRVTIVPIKMAAHEPDGSTRTYTTTIKIVDGHVVDLKEPVLAS